MAIRLTNRTALIFGCAALSLFKAEAQPRSVQSRIPDTDEFLCNDDPWVLVFEDEFEGNRLNPDDWLIVEGVNRDPDFRVEKTWKQAENVVVEDGKLKIITDREHKPGMAYKIWLPVQGTTQFESDFEFTTGEIWTRKKFTHGKIEALVKIPKGKGIWPALWLFCGQPVYNEIDVFEFTDNQFNRLISTFHHDMNGDGKRIHVAKNRFGRDYSLEPHVYTLIWENNAIQVLCDGKRVFEQYRAYHPLFLVPATCELKASRRYQFNEIFPDDPMQIIFDTVCETGPRAPDSTTAFPVVMEVDWIRYYQRKPRMNVVITDADSYPIEEQLFNVIAGDTILISTDFEIKAKHQLDLLARKSIHLEPGFIARAGSFFEARIDSSLFSSNETTVP
ncbi:MAG TPA: glycoside hydrolase family 16 protein [Prolixibacteraceae bacterium]|nr:glycoside hydrolase family 16 protein [Prolixibacteraceae bacterium]